MEKENQIKIKSQGIKTTEFIEKNGVWYVSFPILEKTEVVKHGFSTRLGGVSKDYFSTMNLSFTRGDKRENVLENYRRICAAIDIPYENAVISHQTHTTNIRVVTEEDAGKGIVKERDYDNIDGLITNVPNIPLVTFYADCVPLYFVDVKNRAIGLSHSGWKGTVNRMGKKTIERMNLEYGSDPENIIACIGPSICGSCYEIGEEVAEEFKKSFSEKNWDEILKRSTIASDKYYLNLWKANELVLTEAGIKKENLAVTDLCTKCNPDIFYSHRVMGEKRGNLAAFLCLR